MPFFILLIVIAVIIGPMITIWALNVLFGLGLSITIKTWLAAAILFGHGFLSIRSK